MKEGTIINNFQRIDRTLKELVDKQNQGFGQSFQYIGGVSITLDSLIQMLIERGIFTGEEFRSKIAQEAERRKNVQKQTNEKQIESQPVIENDSTGPSVEASMSEEEPSSGASQPAS